MPWPLDVEYQDAIQDPRLCFSDAELKSCAVVADNFGPWLAWGGFAIVFQIAVGQKRYAVRCFKSAVTDQQKRYGAIGSYLKQLRNPAFADVDFQNSGIKVKGSPYPIVKMEWVSGDRLDAHIEKHLSKPSVLLGLRDEFRRLAKGLRDNRVAHGDLQHRNIIVTEQGRMRLVDYDGMFVPGIVAACGQASPEVGQPNFQHPRRSAGDFNENIDNFSVLVIYLSLWALSMEPDLWSDKTFHNEDTLIFQDHDFVGKSSRLMARLAKSSQPGIRKMAEILSAECRKASASDVRDLESVLRDLGGGVEVQQPDVVLADAAGGEVDELTCLLTATGPWQWSARTPFLVRNVGNASAEVTLTSPNKALQINPSGAFALGPGDTRELSLEMVRLDNEPIKIAAELNLAVGTAAQWWDEAGPSNKPQNQAAIPKNWWDQATPTKWGDRSSPSNNWWDQASPVANARDQTPPSENPWDQAPQSNTGWDQAPTFDGSWTQAAASGRVPAQASPSARTIPINVEKRVPAYPPATQVRTPLEKLVSGWALGFLGVAALAMCVLWTGVILADVIRQRVTGEDREIAFFLVIGLIIGPLFLRACWSRLASREGKCPKCSNTIEFVKSGALDCPHCRTPLALTGKTLQATMWGFVAANPTFRLSLKSLKAPSQWTWPRPHLCCVCGRAGSLSDNIEVVVRSRRFAPATAHRVAVPHCFQHSSGVSADKRGQFLAFKSLDCRALFDDLNRL